MTETSPESLPPRGRFAKVAIDAALDEVTIKEGAPYPPGIFIGRPDCLIVSHGARASVLHFGDHENAARLGLALLTLAASMQEDAERAAQSADAALGRVLAEREAAGNA